MSRRYCPTCFFPKSVCLCPEVETTSATTQIHILQHPSEVKAAKGTVRLLQLVLPETKVYVGENEASFRALRDRVQQNPTQWALLYPSDEAEEISGLAAPYPQHLIALDGTWKKAFRLWQLNPWLKDIRSLTFSTEVRSLYRIRKAKRMNSLSTLESVALSLNSLEGLSLAPFERVLQARMEMFEKFTHCSG